MIYCQIQWTNCDGLATTHESPAVAMAVITKFGKRYAICAEHMNTLIKRKQHHDSNCTHMSEHADEWSIEELSDGEKK